MPREYVWVQTGIPPKCKLSPQEKQRLKALADQFVEDFYKPDIAKLLRELPPKPLGNYIVDIHTKWHGAYLQFIAKYACPGPNALSPYFETAFARLGFFRLEAWSIWARRHNDEWMVLGHQMTLEK